MSKKNSQLSAEAAWEYIGMRSGSDVMLRDIEGSVYFDAVYGEDAADVFDYENGKRVVVDRMSKDQFMTTYRKAKISDSVLWVINDTSAGLVDGPALLTKEQQALVDRIKDSPRNNDVL